MHNKTYPKNRRKKFLIDREIQVGITVRFIAVFIIFILLSTAFVFLPSAIKLLSGAPAEELEKAAQEFLILHRRIWPMILIVIAGTIVYSIFFSHRIAGPVYRLNKELKNIIDGNYPEKIALREKDFFKETATLIEELSNDLKKGVHMRGKIDVVLFRKKLSNLKYDMIAKGVDENFIKSIEEIETIIKELNA
jgi:hypothetical protein